MKPNSNAAARPERPEISADTIVEEPDCVRPKYATVPTENKHANPHGSNMRQRLAAGAAAKGVLYLAWGLSGDVNTSNVAFQIAQVSLTHHEVALRS